MTTKTNDFKDGQRTGMIIWFGIDQNKFRITMAGIVNRPYESKSRRRMDIKHPTLIKV